MIDKSKFIVIEKSLEALSLAVHPQDKMTRPLSPFGNVKVSLRNIKSASIKNPSGYHIFFTLKDSDYTVGIDADYYLNKEFDVTLPDHGLPPGGEIELDDEVKLIELKGGLLAEVSLMPNVNYAFPTGATLVRGEVIDTIGIPVANTIITVSSTTGSLTEINFQTDKKGKFVLYCNRLTKDKILEINSKTFDGNMQLLIHTLGYSLPVLVEVKEGKTVNIKIVF